MNAFSIMEFLFPFFFFAVFGMVLIVFVVTLVRGIGEWRKNNNSPRLTVPAKVVSKRTSVSRGHHHGANGHMHTTSSTWYYATFEVESGDRMELGFRAANTVCSPRATAASSPFRARGISRSSGNKNSARWETDGALRFCMPAVLTGRGRRPDDPRALV